MTLVWLVVVQLREPPTDDMSEANQPPPSPVPTSSRVDNHLLPAVKPEAETTDQKPADPQQVGKPEPDSKPETAAVELKPVSGDQPVKVPSISPTGSEAVVKDTTEKEEKEEREKEEEKAEEKEGGKEEAIEEEAGKVPEEAEKAGEEAEVEKEAEVEGAGAAEEGTPSEPVVSTVIIMIGLGV